MRSHLNHVDLEGNAVRDSGYLVSKKGGGVLSFTLATNKYIGEQKQASFIDVVCFGRVAESVGEIKKGENVVVIGELKQNSWEGADGKKNSRIEVIAHTVLFKDTSSKVEATQGTREDNPGQGEKPVASTFEDDIPF